jgi:hypothetical protein
MHRLALLALLLALTTVQVATADADPTRVLPPGRKPADRRFGPPRTLDDKDFFFRPPATLKEWQTRRQALREQVLVATGLWPLPEPTPLRPVIHGKIDRDGYTVEKVFFASYPGHYVSGNLYRPRTGGGTTSPRPAVLCPHGHWPEGRFFDAGVAAARKQIEQGAEKTLEGARFPLQARCAQLARMGCVVFHYDMVGMADSKALPHAAGFADAQAELWLQSAMGLQTWNSIRALDFVLGLPEVDRTRVGVTGASGGGTQTFILCAVDDRPTAAFPAVMVSTAMQGGCVCENCSYLRQGTGNVELAGLFAPKPLGMTGAHDWTIDIERKGLPELKALYRLLGAEDRVLARCFPQFEHNYNQVSREVMYNWFNQHLRLGQQGPVVEKPFRPVPPGELSVYDREHPRPGDSADVGRLRQYLTAASEKQLAGLRPRDGRELAEFRHVLGTALRVLVHDRLPGAGDVAATVVGEEERRGVYWRRLLLTRKGYDEQVPAVWLRGPQCDGTVVVWVHPEGKASLVKGGRLVPAAQEVLDRKAAILAVDVWDTGELRPEKPRAFEARSASYAGYYFGYNRPVLGERVHDILTALAYARGEARTLHLAGFEGAGPWVLLARALGGHAVTRTTADGDRFRFESVTSSEDERMLPGALKYGGLGALAALAAPGELYVHNERDTGSDGWLGAVYRAAGAGDRLRTAAEKVSAEEVVRWLLR